MKTEQTLDLKQGVSSKTIRVMLQQIHAAEQRAVQLLKLFEQERYLSTTKLLQALREQEGPQVNLNLVLTYVVGYLSGTVHESAFTTEVFGEDSIIDDHKDVTAKAAGMALIQLIDEAEITKLPKKTARRKTAAKKPRKNR